jgi:hypothetical protein
MCVCSCMHACVCVCCAWMFSYVFFVIHIFLSSWKMLACCIHTHFLTQISVPYLKHIGRRNFCQDWFHFWNIWRWVCCDCFETITGISSLCGHQLVASLIYWIFGLCHFFTLDSLTFSVCVCVCSCIRWLKWMDGWIFSSCFKTYSCPVTVVNHWPPTFLW